LVLVDFQQVVAAVVDHLAAQVALAEGGVAGDHPALQHQRLEQGQRRLVLVGLGRDAGLAQHAAGPLVQRRQQMDGRGARRAAAAGGLAVERHGPQPVGRLGRQQVRDPAGDGGLQRLGVEPGEQPLEGAVGGGPAAVAQAVHQLDRLVAAPLRDGGVAAAAAEDRAAGVRQHGDQRVPSAGAVAGVGDIGQAGQEAAGLGLCHRCRLRKGDSLPQINELIDPASPARCKEQKANLR
jgi:hypothetical protein